MGNADQGENQPKTLKPEDIVAMKRLSEAVISPDGKRAAFVRFVPGPLRAPLGLGRDCPEPFRALSGTEPDHTGPAGLGKRPQPIESEGKRWNQICVPQGRQDSLLLVGCRSTQKAQREVPVLRRHASSWQPAVQARGEMSDKGASRLVRQGHTHEEPLQ